LVRRTTFNNGISQENKRKKEERKKKRRDEERKGSGAWHFFWGGTGDSIELTVFIFLPIVK
jgi:hypothetical protein